MTIEVATRVPPPARRVIAAVPSETGCGISTSPALPNFADYPAQTGRLIPMIRLTPAAGD